MKITGNEPASPTVIFEIEQHDRIVYTGLTIRQQFAMAAMQGLCNIGDTNMNPNLAAIIAKEAVIVADSLIAELNKDI